MGSLLDHLRGMFFPRSERKRLLRILAQLEAESWFLRRRLDRLLDDGTSLALAALPPETTRAVRETLGLLAPSSVDGPAKVRLGNPRGDGGYVLLDDLAGVRRAYSLGIGGDASFDLDLAERGIEVLQYDGSIKAPPVEHERLRFQRVYVRAVSEPPTSRTLTELLAQNGDLGRKDLLLKLDVEGDEWDLFAETGADALSCFRQIVCELHDLDRVHVQHERYRRALSHLTRDHAVVHLHANASAPFVGFGAARFPSMLEVSLVRRDLHALVPNRDSYPTPLDRHNPGRGRDEPLSLAPFTPP